MTKAYTSIHPPPTHTHTHTQTQVQHYAELLVSEARGTPQLQRPHPTVSGDRHHLQGQSTSLHTSFTSTFFTPTPPHTNPLHTHTTYLCMDPHTLTSSPTHPPQALPSLTTYNPTPITSPSHKPVSPTKKPKYRARRPHTCVQKTTSAMVLLIDPPSPDHDKVPGYHETDV